MSILVFLVLFSVVYCRINIDISVSYENSTTWVSANGFERHPLTREEQQAFSLMKHDIRFKAIKTRIGNPTYIDVHRTSAFGGRDIYTTLKPTSSKITAIEYESVLLLNRTFNNTGSEAAVFETRIREPRVERIIVGWSTDKKLFIDGDILITFANRIRHISNWNINETRHRVRTLSPPSNVKFTLQPGRGATVSVYALRVLMYIKIEHVVYLDGDLFFKKINLFFADEEYPMDVNEYLYLVNTSNEIIGKQYIIADFYFEGRVFVEDDQTGEFLIDPIDFM